MIKNKIKNKNSKKAEDDPKEQWKVAKSALGWEKNLSPKVIIDQGNILTAPVKIANAINKGFIERNIKLHRSIPQTNTDPLENYAKITEGKNLRFRLKTIDARQLDNIVTKLKPSNSSAIDMISSKTIKKLYTVLKYPLLNLVNISLETAEYPKKLKKKQSGTPTQKGEDPN